MEIGIIGAGHIGGTLTRRLTKLGHTVRVANSRDPQTLADLAAETGATAVWARDAASRRRPGDREHPAEERPRPGAGHRLRPAKPGAPVIETNNYYPQQRDG